MTGPIRAKSVQSEAVDWLWKERVPRGMLTIVAGRPDQGKGLVCSHIAADVSNMRFRDEKGKARYGQVLYSAIEDSHGLMTRPRLEASGANLNNVHLWRFQIPSQLNELEAHVKAKNIDLLVIDPLAAHLSHGVSRHSDTIRTVLNPLTELIESTHTAVLIVEHVLKRVPASGHPLQAIGGSGSGIVAASRMAFLFGSDPADADRRIFAPIKHNITNDDVKALAFEIDSKELDEVGDVPHLLFDEEIEFDPARLIENRSYNTGRVGRPPDKRAAACEWLSDYLYGAGKPVAAGKVIEDAKHYGMTTKTLRRASQDMGVLRNPPGGGRNCTWELPEELKELMDEANGVTRDAKQDADGDVDGESLITDEDIQGLLGDD